MSLADLEIETVEGVLVARVDGEIDMSNAAEIGSAISRGISNEALGVVLDLSGVEYLDSAALHMLFELRSGLRHRGQKLRLVVPPGATITEAVEIMDVPRTIGISPDAETARAYIVSAVPQAGPITAQNQDERDS